MFGSFAENIEQFLPFRMAGDAMTRAVLRVAVKQNRDGSWRVERAGRKIIADHLTYEQAWALWDVRDRQISRIEDARRRHAYSSGRW
jgi:hypothetical protein